MRVGMGNAYTINMIAEEFGYLTQAQWGFYPINGYRRLNDETVLHQVTKNFDQFREAITLHELQVYPTKILEERGRGTLITNVGDQGRLFQSWAWSQQLTDVGVLIPTERLKIECWMKITLQPIPDDSDPTSYAKALKELWLERLRGISEGLAQNIELLGNDWRYQVRYVFNGVRIWFIPVPTFDERTTRPFAEEPCQRDKWYSTTDIMAVAFPTLPDDQLRDVPRIIFGRGHMLQERYDDPEVQGGKIALIAFKHIRVQKPPNYLDRMQYRYLKQVAYNDRVIEAEKEVASINCDVPDFLSEMKSDPEIPVVICVNANEEMKREEEAMGGQL
jgi:hypothetical protein